MQTCDFCGKSQKNVSRIVVSDNGCAICDKCIFIAAQVIVDELKKGIENNEIEFKGENKNE